MLEPEVDMRLVARAEDIPTLGLASLGIEMPAGEPIDVLTGFVRDNGDAMGRPVGVAIDKTGALLVADEIGNVVWRVARSQSR